MKTKTLTKKLKLNKQTVSDLGNTMMEHLKGGNDSNPFCYAPTYKPGANTCNTCDNTCVGCTDSCTSPACCPGGGTATCNGFTCETGDPHNFCCDV